MKNCVYGTKASASISLNPGLKLSLQVSTITILRKLVITGTTLRLSEVGRVQFGVQMLSVAC